MGALNNAAPAATGGSSALGAYKPADSTYASATLADDANLQVTTPVGTYTVNIGCAYNNTNTSAYASIQLAHTGTVSTGNIAYTVNCYAGANYLYQSAWSTALNTTTSGSDRLSWLWLTGAIVVTAPGIFKVRFADPAASGLVVKAGSTLTLLKIA